MTSPHTYACPLRWGDLDMLGHTNNVRYLDYVQEARLELLAAAGVVVDPSRGEQVVVVRHDVSFDAPLMFREEPVTVESRVVEVGAATVVTEHVVLDRPGEGAAAAGQEPVVYFRARTEVCVLDLGLGAPRRLTPVEAAALDAYAAPALEPALLAADPVEEVPEAGTTYAARTRWSDVDGYGHVGNVAQVEYLQEARLRMLGLERWAGHGGDLGKAGGFENLLVVAQTTMTYLRPITFRLRPYEVRSWVSRIGGASFSVSSVVTDPDEPGADGRPSVLARGRVTLVAFDPEAQRSTSLTDSSRAVLERLGG